MDVRTPCVKNVDHLFDYDLVGQEYYVIKDFFLRNWYIAHQTLTVCGHLFSFIVSGPPSVTKQKHSTVLHGAWWVTNLLDAFRNTFAFSSKI